MPFTSIQLSGHQICDYCWVMNRRLDGEELALITDYKNEPTWTIDTTLLNLFNQTLKAGALDSGEAAPTKWRVYRQEVGSDVLVLAANLADGAKSFIDYNVCNNKQYLYQLFVETQSYITAPLSTNVITTDWSQWCLFDVLDTGTPDVYQMNQVFLFALDPNGGTLSNNLQTTLYNNFTPFPKIHKASTNYYSATLQALLGHIDCGTGLYSESGVDLEAALKAFSTNGRKHFLKDIRGHIWQVEITALNFVERAQQPGLPYDVQITWAELGSADGMIITN